MKNTFRKLLPALIIALVLISALAVTAFAADDWMGTVTLKDMSQSGVQTSGYSDIDKNPDWIQVSSNTAANTRAYLDANYYWSWGAKSYYNSKTETLVIVANWYNAVTMTGRDNTSGGYAKGEERISAEDQETVDSRYWSPRWNGDTEPCYHVHNFKTWIMENSDKIKHLELRPYGQGKTTKVTVTEDFGKFYASQMTALETVKYTADFSFRAASNAETAQNDFFKNKGNLTTVQHGTFDTTGEFSTECPNNVVTLTDGVVTGDRFSVGNLSFEGCSSVVRVVIESNASGYIGLKNNMFANCMSLKFVYIGTAMSDSYQVGTDAFKGCSDVNVYVDNTAAATELAAAGVTVKAHSEYKEDLKKIILTSEGIFVKIADSTTESKDNVAIRFIFKWDSNLTTMLGTPKKVGLVACSEKTYSSIAGDDEMAKLEVLLAGGTEGVVQNDVAIYEDGEFTLKGRFLADGTDVAKGIYSYSYTLYGIPADHYDSEIYAATYIQWSDDTYYVVSNGYTDSTGADKNTISLYDVTLGLFKQGLINSEKVADKYLWDVIEGFAEKEKELNTTSATSGINVKYFILPDNIKGGYVIAYRAITKYASDGVTLKGATMPHGVNCGNAPYKLYKEYYHQTNTFIIDHGITAFGGARVFGPQDSGDDNTSIKTVVYPSGLVNTSAATHMFHNCAGLENVIWCHTDSNGNYVEHKTDVVWNENCTNKSSLFDLRGLPSVASAAGSYTYTFTKCATKNIVLPKGTKAFSSTGKVVWTES